MSLRNTPPVKIYGDMRIRAFRVVWICEELGLPWELEHVWPWSDEIYSLNPLGKVPVIIDGDAQIYESAAILNYLAEKYQDAAGLYLVPKPGTKERALYDQFLMVIFLDIEALGLWTHRKFIDLALYSSNSDLMNDLQYIHIPEAASPAKVTFERSLKILAEELRKHKFLLGDNFTALDIHLLRDLEWADALDWLTGNPTKAFCVGIMTMFVLYHTNGPVLNTACVCVCRPQNPMRINDLGAVGYLVQSGFIKDQIRSVARL
jgi:glutathione S-transferase